MGLRALHSDRFYKLSFSSYAGRFWREREGNFVFKRQRLGWKVQKYGNSHRISDFNPGLTMQKQSSSRSAVYAH